MLVAVEFSGRLTTMFAGTFTTGFSVSLTVTVNEPVVVLPWPSVAVTFTVVVPFGKVLPEGMLVLTLAVPQLSLALRPVKLTTAEQEPGSFLTTTFGALSVTGAGAVIGGGVLSSTVTV